MKHKKYGHDSFTRSKARHLVTVWGFLILAVFSGVVTLNAYIGNSREAKARYEKLLAVDAAGGDVEGALYSLRSYMYAHMNTELGNPLGIKPIIQLRNTYTRLETAEKARVAAAKEANANLYNTAQQVCEQLIPDGLSGRGRIPCITEYVTTHAQSEKENNIPEDLYKFEFVSPRWSPDTAGYGILITSLLTLIFLFRWITYRRALHLLRTAT